jgi:16S rRNA C1402 N4-methylase RsmH
MLTIDWNIDKGYIIKRRENQSEKELIYEKELSENDKNKIGKIVEEYGSFSTKELSIITTAIFLKEEVENIKSTDDLVKIIISLKPDYTEDVVRKILKKSRVIS